MTSDQSFSMDEKKIVVISIFDQNIDFFKKLRYKMASPVESSDHLQQLQQAIEALEIILRVDQLKAILGSELFAEFRKDFPEAPLRYKNESRRSTDIDLNMLEQYALVQWARHYLQTGNFGSSVPDLVSPPNFHYSHYDPIGDIPFRELMPQLLASVFSTQPREFLNRSLEDQIKIACLGAEVITTMQEAIPMNQFRLSDCCEQLKNQFNAIKARDTKQIRQAFIEALPKLDSNLDAAKVKDFGKIIYEMISPKNATEDSKE